VPSTENNPWEGLFCAAASLHHARGSKRIEPVMDIKADLGQGVGDGGEASGKKERIDL
jgi:hypothetical protein